MSELLVSELEWLKQLSFSDGIEALRPALIFAISVAVFGLVIFHLHKFMAKRNPFVFDISGLRKSGNLVLLLLYAFIYLIRFGLFLPTFIYLWYWILVVVLAFLYNSMEPGELLLIAMAVLTAIRVTSYYNEDLARDIAKILPYGLLGIFVINLGQFDLDKSLALLENIGAEIQSAFYYWLYIVCQELFLRVSYPYVMASVGVVMTAYLNLHRRMLELVKRGESSSPSSVQGNCELGTESLDECLVDPKLEDRDSQ